MIEKWMNNLNILKMRFSIKSFRKMKILLWVPFITVQINWRKLVHGIISLKGQEINPNSHKLRKCSRLKPMKRHILVKSWKKILPKRIYSLEMVFKDNHRQFLSIHNPIRSRKKYRTLFMPTQIIFLVCKTEILIIYFKMKFYTMKSRKSFRNF